MGKLTVAAVSWEEQRRREAEANRAEPQEAGPYELALQRIEAAEAAGKPVRLTWRQRSSMKVAAGLEMQERGRGLERVQ